MVIKKRIKKQKNKYFISPKNLENILKLFLKKKKRKNNNK